MKRLFRHVMQRLSVRLSLFVALTTALLLLAAQLVMLHYARKEVKEEALLKAKQSLEGTVQNIDNILLSVEQTAGNIYWNMLAHLGDPDGMFTYSRKVVETNPYVDGCAIAMEPYYYKDRGQYFMAYVHLSRETATASDNDKALATSDSPIIQAETFGDCPYNEQIWYTKSMEEGRPCWIGPLKDKDAEGGAIITFCLPIYNSQGQRVGVMGVDVALSRLSEIVLAAKPSPNAYCALIDHSGSYIVHPDSAKLQRGTVYSYYEASDNQSIKDAAASMVSGKEGYQEFRNDNDNWFVFYKPFHRADVPGRSTGKLDWSAGIVYPEDDIFGEYNRMAYFVLAVSLIGLVLLLVLSYTFTHKRLLPLRMLAKSAESISEGNFDEPIPDSRQEDEIGMLQVHFQQMQQSLAAHVSELERLRSSLEQQGAELQAAYDHAQQANHTKTAFLHNMTDQMSEPANHIVHNVKVLCNGGADMSQEEASGLVDDIQRESKIIMDVLNEMLNDLIMTSKR